MYEVQKNGRTVLEADACGIGFVATRKGVAERGVVELGLDLARRFDHRGAPGHGAGVLLDIPWPMLLDRFPEHAKAIAQRDVALGMFFLPFDGPLRRRCVEAVEGIAQLAGAEVLQWADVPIDADALPLGSSARRTVPVVRQALFARPLGLSEDGWFACRYLLRLALDSELEGLAGDEFSVVSLSNRTVVYKGLAELSRIADLYPDLRDPAFASRFVVFHSRYCTNTTTAWRRAQPFWALAHNGEISTIQGNVAWMQAIGKGLIRSLGERHPSLGRLAERVCSVVCSGGSDSANLDDMLLSLVAGGMSLTQSLLALLPASHTNDPTLAAFYEATGVYLGACDGPAAVVACDGDEAVAHLDRNGLRPLWVATTREHVFASSEPIEPLPSGEPLLRRCLGPGDTVLVRLATGSVLSDGDPGLLGHGATPPVPAFDMPATTEELPSPADELGRWQRAFGMTKEDIEVLLEPLCATGKSAIGSMGDDTPPSALLDTLPRRLEDHFALRFAQETSPPIDPIRDEWVFDPRAWVGDRSGLWERGGRGLFRFESRLLSHAEIRWLEGRPGVARVPLFTDSGEGPDGLERALDEAVLEALGQSDAHPVLVLTDHAPAADRVALPALRVVSRLHQALVERGARHRVGLVVEAGIWDVHHCALLLAMGADAVAPWLGSLTAGDREGSYLKGLRSGFVETMSMLGVTPSSAYVGSRLVEAVGLDPAFVREEFPGVPCHLGGIGRETLDAEWLGFHRDAYSDGGEVLPDVAEFRQSKEGRRHFNDAGIVRAVQLASGYARKIHGSQAGSWDAYRDYSELVSGRPPITVLDCLRLKEGEPIPLEEVEPEEAILWRFMAPGMSEGALSEPAHRAVASAFNLLHRYCRLRFRQMGLPLPPGLGPLANSGEGGFDKARIGRRDGNRSVQYAGGRFTITPETAARAAEAEVKFAQGAKPGKGGQLPGRKVSVRVAHQRGCEPGYELVSPPINHNLYSIEDVKLMLESWRHLNPDVTCALKYVATYGVEMVALGGVNAGANRLHLSDGCGGTGAAKRTDQKHAGVPAASVLPTVQDLLVEEGVRHLVEVSVDGGVQSGEQALKLVLLGADRVGFGTSALIAIGCSMLRQCHLAGPHPGDPTGARRLGCAPGVATQDPALVAKFRGRGVHIARFLRFVAREVRERMAAAGIRSLSDVVGRRDLLEKKPDLVGKAALLDLSRLVSAPDGLVSRRDLGKQSCCHRPGRRVEEVEAAEAALRGESVFLEALAEGERGLGVAAAGVIARAAGDLGLRTGGLRMRHRGSVGHFHAAYCVNGMTFELDGVAADSCFTAAYGGTLVIRPHSGDGDLAVVGNAFGYGARGGEAYLAGGAGNRFGICLRKNHEGGGPRLVVEGVQANAFQYMTGGTALVLGHVGPNLGSGMTGGAVYLLDAVEASLNRTYVQALPLPPADEAVVRGLLEDHLAHTGSPLAACLLDSFEPERYTKVVTRLEPEPLI